MPEKSGVTAFWSDTMTEPTGTRSGKPRTSGLTMVMDKGLGMHAFRDLLDTAGDHLDRIKLGFGTAALYPPQILREKIQLCRDAGVCLHPGGTFLEAAIRLGEDDSYLEKTAALGFEGVEISDGTIALTPARRSALVRRAAELGLRVFTEYGKKSGGSRIAMNELVETVLSDVEDGAETVTIEGRESGAGVGIYDESGQCRDEEILEVTSRVPSSLLLWEAPHKDQQAHLLLLLGNRVNLGNVAPTDALALEALRRGLRSDTMELIPNRRR
ncbi:phosphosulfolactate synthase [Gorillibacterium timonense]|uniref:phosphosulfolactate synthase n=1 Tax=Gorillibacterium timonense TaxID=1689269 RepID=UPI00071C4CA5|nr:phosphosulfolactate synthase [Gorillibacterium timonense]